MTVTLHGYRYSVYLRIARIALIEKGVSYAHVEVDPFADPVPQDYLRLNPFGRVPTLVHGEFVLYETQAITRYVDEAFAGPPLQPSEPKQRARMAQVMSIADSYVYWPAVRQVFAERVFAPRISETPDEAEIAAGLEVMSGALGALENLVSGSSGLVTEKVCLADIHLAPMMTYFTAAPEGDEALRRYPRLCAWWTTISTRQSLQNTTEL